MLVKRHFEFREIEVRGKSVTVGFGRSGSAGQSQTKTFDSAKKADAAAAKLIREKPAKGYRETGADAPSRRAICPHRSGPK